MKMRTFRHLRTLTSKLSSRIRQKRLIKKWAVGKSVEEINTFLHFLEMLLKSGRAFDPQLIKSWQIHLESEVNKMAENQQNTTYIYRGDEAAIAEQKRKAAADADTELQKARVEYMNAPWYTALFKKWKYQRVKRRYDATIAASQQQN